MANKKTDEDLFLEYLEMLKKENERLSFSLLKLVKESEGKVKKTLAEYQKQIDKLRADDEGKKMKALKDKISKL